MNVPPLQELQKVRLLFLEIARLQSIEPLDPIASPLSRKSYPFQTRRRGDKSLVLLAERQETWLLGALVAGKGLASDVLNAGGLREVRVVLDRRAEKRLRRDFEVGRLPSLSPLQEVEIQPAVSF